MFENFLIEEYWPLLAVALGIFAFVGVCLFLISISKQDQLANRVQRGKENGLRLADKTYRIEYIHAESDRRILDAVILGERSGLVFLDIPASHPSWKVVSNLKEGDRFTLSFNSEGERWGLDEQLSLEAGSRYVFFRRV